MKISFEKMCEFHKFLTEYYAQDGFDEIFLKPLPSGFEIIKIKRTADGAKFGQRVWYQQDDYNKDLEKWIEK